MMVKEVAELAGISVRTLHHYDEIGLLHPSRTTEAGYRVYSDEDLALLQQILFFRELGFPLKQIRKIVCSPGFDRQEAMELHHKFLLEKRSRLERMIETLEKTIKHEKGEIKMTNQDKFAGFDFSSNPYEEEARERYGDKAVNESNEKLNKLSKKEQGELGEEMNAIYRKLAELRHESPASDEAQQAIGEWYEFLTRMGSYSLEAFKGLGQMYVCDERFTRNIDQFGEGLAVFMRDAMAEYADSRQA
ncbi:MerR family transcriptional regulator [Paenibacillus sp.]|jgi:DNA-binding transcriptional MerR regulator|uniref:MerR family transcriptional regulator n=1 Tax=Paenibacillus sp. TaxID=58172 RepID=UPI002823BF27|nr:MerR family transcriptional regulator [Paenibacillus sp.]MDR0269549.1 MerR family transcriptional regulator [Paenibacillus sp.]